MIRLIDGVAVEMTPAEQAAHLATIAMSAPSVAEMRTAGIATVNALAGRARLAYVTDAPGQAMVYLAKQAEAARYLADPEPNLGTYPMLSAEVGITAPSVYELAQLWANMAAIWSSAAAQIEAARLTAIAAISAAASTVEIDEAIITLMACLETT